MAIQLINTGTGANKGDGDSLRSAFTKINNNFTELTNYLGSTVTDFTEIVEDVVVIKFSKIVKENDKGSASIAGPDVQQALEQVAQELVGEGIIVEVAKP